MAGFSNHLAQATINHFFRKQPVTGPAAHFLALFSSDPTDVTSTALTRELAGAWYARQAVAFDVPVDTADVSTANTAGLTFPAVTVSTVTATHWGVMDASTVGNLLASGEFTVPKVLNVDDVPKLNAGELVLTFD